MKLKMSKDRIQELEKQIFELKAKLEEYSKNEKVVIIGGKHIALRLVNAKKRRKRAKKDPGERVEFRQFYEKMKESTRRDLHIIAEYADEMKNLADRNLIDTNGFPYHTRGQWDKFTRRNLRIAKQLEVYDDEQIALVMQRVIDNIRNKRIHKLTLEKIFDYLNSGFTK